MYLDMTAIIMDKCIREVNTFKYSTAVTPHAYC